MWKYLFLLVLAVFPFGQLASISFLGFLPNVRFHLIDLAGFLFVLDWLFFEKKEKKPFYFKSLCIFLAFAGLSLGVKAFSLNLNELVIAFFYLIRIFIWFFFWLAADDYFVKYKVKIFDVLIYEGLFVGILSLGQYFFLPDTRFLQYSGWDDHLFRAIGPFLDPAFNSLILVLAFIALVSKIFSNKYQNRTKSIWLFFLLIIILAIGLSFSRMAYFLLSISAILFLVLKKQFKILLIGLICFFFLIFLLPKPTGEGVDLLRTRTGQVKLENYRQSISIIKANLILGVGFNTIRSEYFRRGYLSDKDVDISHSGSGADNSFLFVFATTGIFGFMAFLTIYFTLLKETIVKKNTFLVTTLVCLIISAFFINSLFYPWILCWWGIAGAGFKAGTEV